MSARIYTTDPLEQVALKLPISLRDRIDQTRGTQPRMSWIRDACLAHLEREGKCSPV